MNDFPLKVFQCVCSDEKTLKCPCSLHQIIWKLIERVSAEQDFHESGRCWPFHHSRDDQKVYVAPLDTSDRQPTNPFDVRVARLASSKPASRILTRAPSPFMLRRMIVCNPLKVRRRRSPKPDGCWRAAQLHVRFPLRWFVPAGWRRQMDCQWVPHLQKIRWNKLIHHFK